MQLLELGRDERHGGGRGTSHPRDRLRFAGLAAYNAHPELLGADSSGSSDFRVLSEAVACESLAPFDGVRWIDSPAIHAPARCSWSELEQPTVITPRKRRLNWQALTLMCRMNMDPS